MILSRMRDKKYIGGFMLMELAIVLIIVGIGTAWYSTWLTKQNDELMRSLVVGQMLDIEKAAINYTATYAAQIRASTAVTGVAVVTAPTVAELASLNVGLPSTFVASGVINTGYTVNISLLSPSNDLQTIVRTTTPITNDFGVADTQWASNIVTKIGAKGAHSTATSPASLTGMGGAWTMANPAGSVAGIVAIRDTLSANLVGSQFWKDPVADYISLPVAGNLQGDTRLVTNINRTFSWNGAAWIANNIDQNGNLNLPGTLGVTGAITGGSVSTTGTVSAVGGLNTGLTAAIGASCTGTGTIAKDVAGSGLLLSCQSGVWSNQNAGNTGSWKFGVLPNPFDYYLIGDGIYNASNSTFSGTLWCDQALQPICGSGALKNCGDGAAAINCVQSYVNIMFCWGPSVFNCTNGLGYHIAYVTNLPVNSVTRRW